jgi:hypothetical protein
MEYYLTNDELYHHGIQGMKWGIRRYQNEDGTYTEAGKKRRAKTEKEKATADTYIDLYGGKANASRAVATKGAVGSSALGMLASAFGGLSPILANAAYMASPVAIEGLATALGAAAGLVPAAVCLAGSAYIGHKTSVTLANIKDSEKGHDSVVLNKNKK